MAQRFSFLLGAALITKSAAASNQPTRSLGRQQTEEPAGDSSFLDPFGNPHTLDAIFLNDETASLDLQDDDDDPECDDKTSNRYDPLACWLWKLKVKVPDQSFKKSYVTVEVSELVCSSFKVDSIDSQYVPSNQGQTNPSIDLAVSGISASCNGKYHVTGGASGKLSLKAIGQHDDQPAMHLIFDFDSSYSQPNATSAKYWMPSALATRQCEAELKCSTIHFSGSASAMVANLFSIVIKHTVSSQLNEILCPKIKDAVDPFATESIVSLVHTLTRYLGNSSTFDDNAVLSTIPNNPKDLRMQRHALVEIQGQYTSVDFEKDTPLLVKSLDLANHFLDCFYAPKGQCTSLLIKGLRAILSTVLDSLAEEVHLPIPAFLHKVEFKLPLYGRILLEIQDLHVGGLNNLSGLEALSPMWQDDAALSDFRTRVGTGAGLNVTADVNITVFPIPGGIIHGDPLHEAFHVHLNVSSLDALGVVGVALKSDQFQMIDIGTVLDSLPTRFHPDRNSHDPSVDRKCLLDTLQTLRVNDMQAEAILESVTLVPRFNSSQPQQRRLSIMGEKLERDVDEVINHGLALVLAEYQPLLTDAAAGFVRTALVSIVNNWIDKNVFHKTSTSGFISGALDAPTNLVPSSNDVCSSKQDGVPQLVNFTNLGYLKKLNEYVNKPSTLQSINRALDKLAAKADRHHAMSFSRALAAVAGGLDAIPGVSVKLLDLQIDDLGSLQHIDVLSPQLDGLSLKSGFSMAQNSSGASPTIQASIGVMYRPRNLAATLNVTVSVGEISLDGGQILRFDMTRLRQLSFIDLLSHGHCVLVPFKGHQIYSNQNVSGIGTLFANASISVVGETFDNFTTFMDTTTYPSAASLITSVVGWTMDTLQVTANSFARSSFDYAEGYCTGGKKFGYDEHPPVLDDHWKSPWVLPVVYVVGGLWVLAQLAFLGAYILHKKHGGDGAISNEAEDLGEQLLPFENGDSEAYGDDGEKDRQARPSETLVQSTALSAFSRHAMPVFIFGTIVLLVSSNISSGATVDLDVSWKHSQTISLPAIFTFSLLNTAKDMWQAQIYPLFFLVLIMSGIWPYTKLLLMLGAWLTPVKLLGARTRESLLLALDALGKFALIDFLLFVLMMVAFRYHLDVTDQISVDVFVSPETGFYSFLAATCFSLIIGHFMVYCHRLSEMRHLSLRQDESVAQFKESIFGHNFVIAYSNEGARRLRLSRRFRGALLFMMLLAVVLLSVGITQESFKFEIGGLAGDLLGDHRTTYYSLLSLGSSLRRSVKDPSSLGIIVLEIIFYFYAVVTPFACLGILFFLLLCPMTLSSQRVVLALAEIANAWSAIEVFVIAIIASLLEISTFASFIVGHHCDLINQILKEHFESAIPDASDATCFTVRSSVENSTLVLVLGVLVNSIIVSILLRFAHCSVAERIEAEMDSSLICPSDDALDPDESHRPRTVAGFLYCGCFRWIFFEHGRASALRQRYGILPQSTDTYSVAAEVNWQEDASFFTFRSPFSRRTSTVDGAVSSAGPTSSRGGPISPASALGPTSPFGSPTTPFDDSVSLEDQESMSGPAAANESVLETIRNAFN